MSKDYNSSDIKVLTDREHVRQRTQIYLGNMNRVEYTVPSFMIPSGFSLQTFEFVPAVFKSVGEILDNCIDELTQINKRTKKITIQADTEKGVYIIADNGRGIPIGKHETGKYTPEVALGSLRAGRNFDETSAGVIGQNGVGSACVNYCSSHFEIKINRDGKSYNQKFKNGANKITKPKITNGPRTTGTEIAFQLDKDVFEQGIGLPDDLMHGRAIEIAFNNPGTTVTYGNHVYKFNHGLDDLIKKISKNYFKFCTDDMEFYVVFDQHTGIDEQMYTWVNSSLLFDGGLCNTQFTNAFCDNVCNSLKTAAKKQRCTVTKNDVRQNLLIFGILKLAKPEYDAQSKTRLTGPNLRKEIQDMIPSQWKAFARQNKEWLEEVLVRANERHHLNANKKAVNDLSKNLKKKVPGLTDATSKRRYECSLIITEGLSAASMITEVRDPKTIGSFPLTGKINNVYGASAAEVLKMSKVTNLLLAVGLIPSKKAVRSDLRFGKLYLATDADPDGDDIMTLLVNLFHQFWPELFDQHRDPFIHRLVAPNVVASKGNKRVHFTNRAEYEKKKGRYSEYSIEYMKGLGSMMKSDWEIILNGKNNSLIPIVDDGMMTQTLKLLFSDDADARKRWLQ